MATGTSEKVAIKAKNLLSGFEIIKFDVRTLPFSKRKSNKNDAIFIKWLIELLDEYNTKNTLCLYMNSNGLDFLHDKINPMLWLNYSPKENNSLEDDEILINLMEVQNGEL